MLGEVEDGLSTKRKWMFRGEGYLNGECESASLLVKWRWRLLTCENAVWKWVLMAKYGNIISGVPDIGGEIWPRVVSRW